MGMMKNLRMMVENAKKVKKNNKCNKKFSSRPHTKNFMKYIFLLSLFPSHLATLNEFLKAVLMFGGRVIPIHPEDPLAF